MQCGAQKYFERIHDLEQEFANYLNIVESSDSNSDEDTDTSQASEDRKKLNQPADDLQEIKIVDYRIDLLKGRVLEYLVEVPAHEWREARWLLGQAWYDDRGKSIHFIPIRLAN